LNNSNIEDLRNEYDNNFGTENFHAFFTQEETALNPSELVKSEQELEKVVSRIKGIDRRIIQILQNNYEQLLFAQQNNDQTSARASQDKIEKISKNFLKDKILLERVRVNRVQEICRLCKKIAELRCQEKQLEQKNQLQAQVEILPKQN
jgi:hypothetical protein